MNTCEHALRLPYHLEQEPGFVYKKWDELCNSGVGKNKRKLELMKEFLNADGDYSSPYFEKIRAFRAVMSGHVTKTNKTSEQSAEQHSTAQQAIYCSITTSALRS